MFRPHSMQEDR